MRNAFLPLLAAGITPILVLTLVLIVFTPGLFGFVKWQPPILWTTPVVGPFFNVNVDSIAADSSNIYATGQFTTGDWTYVFLNKYDQSGHQLWSQHFSSRAAINVLNEPLASASSVDGAVYVASLANQNAVLQKFDVKGNSLWTSQFGNLSAPYTGTSTAPYLASVSAQPGHVYLAGTAIVNRTYIEKVATYDSDGKLLWSTILGNVTGNAEPFFGRPLPVSVYADSNAVYVATNLINSTYVRKLDPSGVPQWSHNSDYPLAGVFGDTMGIYVVGESYPTMILSRVDPNGSLLWNVKTDAPDGGSISGGSRVAISSSGIYVTENEFVVKYDLSGNRIWHIQLPVYPNEDSRSYAISAGSGGVYVAAGVSLLMLGGSSSLIMFGFGPPYSFVISAIMGSIVVASILWARRRWKNRIQRHLPGAADIMRYGHPSD